MPGHAAGFACLMVALHVAGPSVVELTVGDQVRLDRVTESGAQRVGGLLRPGTTSVRLDEGTYVFRTSQDAQVSVEDGADVRVVELRGKDLPPVPQVDPIAKGDTPPARVPALVVR